MRTSHRLTAAALLLLGTQAALAASDAFLILPGVPGDSQVVGREGQIELSSLSTGVANRTCFGVNVTKNIDVASPLLSAAAIVGAVYPSATIQVVAPGERPRTYLTFQLINVTVTSVSVGGASGGGVFHETVTLQPTSITMTYIPQTRTGQDGTPVSQTLVCSKK